MKKIFYFLFFIFFLTLTPILNAKENIVFIDLNYILNKSNSGKKILNELNIISNDNKKNFSSQETLLEKERNDIKKLKNILSKDEYNKKVVLFQEKVELYNKEKAKIIKSFENKKKKELDIFFKSLNEIMNVYMKENSISIIIDKKNIVMAAIKNDISNDIIELINK
mgnify:FL=1|tara:strand:- start:118 stop:618 length:501 start_codon:yes stop_codon:yes gene_type:complete